MTLAANTLFDCHFTLIYILDFNILCFTNSKQ